MIQRFSPLKSHGPSPVAPMVLALGLGTLGAVALAQAQPPSQKKGASPPRPRSYTIDPRHLPEAYQTPSRLRLPRVVPLPQGARPQVPPGFRIDLFAQGLDHPRWLAVAPNGDVFCVESRIELRRGPQPNRVVVLRDSNHDGHADQSATFADGLNLPLGVAFHDHFLYVANTGSLVRWPYQPGQLKATSAPETVLRDIPERGYNQHWTRNILFAPDGRSLFLTVGSEKNLAEEAPPRASVLQFAVDATGRPLPRNGKTSASALSDRVASAHEGRTFAWGLRNPVGLAINPRTKALWTVCNERDYEGDDLVPDFATSLRPGGFYGWPYYYIGAHHDPRMPVRPALRARSLVPDVLLQAHSAPLGLVFYAPSVSGMGSGHPFPISYRGDAFVALHGSTNRSRRTGYKVARIHFDSAGRPTGGYEDFVWGWLPDEKADEVWGRPAGLAIDQQGALLIADDAGDRIWRVTYKG